MQQRKSGVILSYVNLIVSLGLGLFYTPFLLRFLGDSEYGLYSLAAALISYLSLLDLGFGNTLIRYNSNIRAKGEKDAVLNGMFLVLYSIIAVVSVAVGSILCLNIDSFFEASFTIEELEKARIIFIILLANVSVSFPISVFTSLIKSYEHFTFSKIVTIMNTVVSKVLTLIILYLGFRTSVVVAAVTAIVNVSFGIASVWYCFKNLKVSFSFEKFDSVLFKEIAIYSIWIFVNILVDQLYASTDSVILARYCGTVAVSVYSIGVVLKNYFQELSVAISGVFLPHISQLLANDQKNMSAVSEIFNRISRLQYVLLIFILVFFFVFGKDFVLLWAGVGYETSYYIALIIMVPSIIPLSQNLGITILQALNMHKFRSVVYLIIAVFNVIISIPLAQMYEGVGAAVGTALATVVGQILVMNIYYSKKIHLDIKTYWKNVCGLTIKMIPIAVMGFIIDSIFVDVSWAYLLLKIAVLSIVYMVYAWLIIYNSYEKSLLKGIFNRMSRFYRV